jgi:hypothetical protein
MTGAVTVDTLAAGAGAVVGGGVADFNFASFVKVVVVVWTTSCLTTFPLGVADLTDDVDDETDDATDEQAVCTFGCCGCLQRACSFFFFDNKSLNLSRISGYFRLTGATTWPPLVTLWPNTSQ